VNLTRKVYFPRSQILFGNAGFDAMHHTSCTLPRVGAGIPNFEVGNEESHAEGVGGKGERA